MIRFYSWISVTKVAKRKYMRHFSHLNSESQATYLNLQCQYISFHSCITTKFLNFTVTYLQISLDEFVELE